MQHTEAVRRCDQAVKDAERYKRDYRTTKDRAEQLDGELRSLRVENSDLMSERTRLEEEVKQRAAKRDLDSSLSSSDDDEDESLKRECESLRALHSTAASKV